MGSRLLAISALLITQNISLVTGFQSLSQAHFRQFSDYPFVDPFSRSQRRNPAQKRPLLSLAPTDDELPPEKQKDPIEKESVPSPLPIVDFGPITNSTETAQDFPLNPRRKKLALMWCAEDFCKDAVRERVRGDHNQIVLDGPATGQVAYYWQPDDDLPFISKSNIKGGKKLPPTTEPSVLLLVKPNADDLVEVAANAVRELTNDKNGIHISVDSSLAGKLKFQYGVDNERMHLFEPKGYEGYGGSHVDTRDKVMNDFSGMPEDSNPPYDLICTLGGDGLLMHASMLFQGPVPPVISIAGGSLGFLTQFPREEMVDAVRIALGLSSKELKKSANSSDGFSEFGDYGMDSNVFPPNMPSYPYEPLQKQLSETPRFSFGLDDRICLSIRMRLDCRIFNPEGVCRARFNVLNEVVIDRGSSPYLAALECFCDDVHLTTVQADGVIFAT